MLVLIAAVLDMSGCGAVSRDMNCTGAERHVPWLMAEPLTPLVPSAPSVPAPPPQPNAPVSPPEPTPVSAPAADPAVGAPPPTPDLAAPATTTSLAPPPQATAPKTTTPETAAPDTATPDPNAVSDPWEKANRAIFKFDTSLERGLLGPVAHGYMKVVPTGVRGHISNLLSNLDEPFSAGNDILQLHFGKAIRSLARIVLNTTVGIGGLFDVAGQNGLVRHHSDFGQTLGRYGVKPGRYVVLPLFGPSNIRDAFGLLIDNVTDPVSWVFGGFTSNFGAAREGAWVIDWRARNEDTIKVVYEATDPYATARSGYMQHRSAAVQEATGKSAPLPDFDDTATTAPPVAPAPTK